MVVSSWNSYMVGRSLPAVVKIWFTYAAETTRVAHLGWHRAFCLLFSLELLSVFSDDNSSSLSFQTWTYIWICTIFWWISYVVKLVNFSAYSLSLPSPPVFFCCKHGSIVTTPASWLTISTIFSSIISSLPLDVGSIAKHSYYEQICCFQNMHKWSSFSFVFHPLPPFLSPSSC